MSKLTRRNILCGFSCILEFSDVHVSLVSCFEINMKSQQNKPTAIIWNSIIYYERNGSMSRSSGLWGLWGCFITVWCCVDDFSPRGASPYFPIKWKIGWNMRYERQNIESVHFSYTFCLLFIEMTFGFSEYLLPPTCYLDFHERWEQYTKWLKNDLLSSWSLSVIFILHDIFMKSRYTWKQNWEWKWETISIKWEQTWDLIIIYSTMRTDHNRRK